MSFGEKEIETVGCGITVTDVVAVSKHVPDETATVNVAEEVAIPVMDAVVAPLLHE